VRRSLETEPPNSASSDAVTTPAAMMNASRPVTRAIFSRGRGIREALRRPNGSSSLTAGASPRRWSGSGSKRSGPSPRAPTRSGSRVRAADGSKRRIAAPVPDRRVTRGATALTCWTGLRSPSETSATTTGVIAVARTVPCSQIRGTTVAAITAARAEISRVWIERPPAFFCSRS
jgi:hypothetical protein